MGNDKVTDVVKFFKGRGIQEYLDYFSGHCPYRGPSLHFHERVIDLRRSKPFDQLLEAKAH